MATFGEIFRREMEVRRLRVSDLERASGVSHAAISRARSLEVPRFREGVLESMCQAMGMTAEEMVDKWTSSRPDLTPHARAMADIPGTLIDRLYRRWADESWKREGRARSAFKDGAAAMVAARFRGEWRDA